MRTTRHGAMLLLAVALVANPTRTAAQSVSAPPNLILPNYDRLPIGQQEGIEAGAYLARTGDAGSNWYNPAGLAKSRESAVNASANAYEWTSTELEGLGEVAGRSAISSIGTLFSAVLGKGPLTSDRWRFGFSIARPIVWQPSSIELGFPQQNGEEKIAYYSGVSFDVMIPGIAVAYAPGGVEHGRFRAGAGLGLAMTSLTQNQATSNRVTNPTTATTTVRSFVASGSSWDVRLNGGVQWDATPAISLGLTAVAPTFNVRGSAGMNLQSLQVNGPAMDDLVLRDPEASFEYKLPGEVSAGASLRGKRGDIEADVHYYASIASYDMYSSTATGTRRVVDAGGAITVSSVGFASTANSARSVTNVAVGGSYVLTPKWRLHGGFASDRSPVPDGTGSTFRQVDLSRITSGVSLSGASLTGSLGFGYAFGSGTRHGIVTDENGQPLDTRLKVKTANLLFALSYSFQPK